MNLVQSMEVMASGLSVARERMNVSASNLANAQTTRTPEGGPYRRKDLVISAVPVSSSFGELLKSRMRDAVQGVAVQDVVSDSRPPRTSYDPGHPDADKDGIVRLPNVNMVEEMVDMITASRAYESGVSALQSIKSMAGRAMTIGR